jgi:murein DD-endopeptidase MepM/ murein hydrolase activator NlpD
MMTGMEPQKPVGFSRPADGEDGEQEIPENQSTPPKSSLLGRTMETLARLGLGEVAVRIGTNVLAVALLILVVWLMQLFYRQAISGGNSSAQAAPSPTATPMLSAGSIPLPMADSVAGVSRTTSLHTTIPSRPRIDVIKYTVQKGDTIFGIAAKFGLKPKTILFGNYALLKDAPDSLRPDQVLNILPVDGTYYEWQGTENLAHVAEFFGVDADAIVNYPGNHLDPDIISNNENINIPVGNWLIIPGGVRAFTSWTAPAQLVREDPSVRVWGAGVCSGITVVQVGYGTFKFPTTEHWLSGTDYRPDVNHFGVDFAGSLGNAIYAVDAGTVVYAGWNDWGYGNLIILDHGNGWQSLYAHLSQINVSCSQNVGQSDVIGLMGSTGNSSGPHLHFELNYNGAHIDPHVIYTIASP